MPSVTHVLLDLLCEFPQGRGYWPQRPGGRVFCRDGDALLSGSHCQRVGNWRADPNRCVLHHLLDPTYLGGRRRWGDLFGYQDQGVVDQLVDRRFGAVEVPGGQGGRDEDDVGDRESTIGGVRGARVGVDDDPLSTPLPAHFDSASAIWSGGGCWNSKSGWQGTRSGLRKPVTRRGARPFSRAASRGAVARSCQR